MLYYIMEEKGFNYRSLIIRFFAGEISEAETEALKRWLEKSSANRRIFDRENELWQELTVLMKPEHSHTEKNWSGLSDSLGLGRSSITPFIVLQKRRFIWLLAAASVAFLVTTGGLAFWMFERKSGEQVEAASNIVRTDDGQMTQIFLSDSTQIYLNSSSEIKYSSDYDKNDRHVILKGEAFFNVRTDSEKPFVVKLGKVTVSATGTRFNVLSYSNENRIETTLEEGKLAVAIEGQDIIDLKSGQQVVYFVRTNKALVRDVTTDTYTSWKENKLRFIDTPFDEVLRKIARKYNVTFEIRNKELLDLKYTATFIDESIEDVMLMLQTISPITYKIIKRTTIYDKQYLKPKIIVGKRKIPV